MTTAYDPTIISTFAERLYTQANRIITLYTLLFGLMCGIGGALFGAAMGGHSDGFTFAIVGIVALGAAGAWVGYSLGQERAFALKLQAQTALCQMRIEENTRRA